MDKFIYNIEQTKLSDIILIDSVKQQLRIESDFTDDDSFIQELIPDATKLAEDYTGQTIALTEFTYTLYNWSGSELTISETPFYSIISLQYKNDLGVMVDIPDEYIVDKKVGSFTLHFDSTVNYKEIVFKFKSGYESSNVPRNIKRAILVKCSDLYDTERGSYSYNAKSIQTFERLLAGSVITRW